MPASKAQILANQQNAAKSTGPRTPEGKANSRRNGLKHGLTGAGIVRIEQDLLDTDSRHASLLAELAPQSEVGNILVGQLAMASIKMQRASRQEIDAIAFRVRHASEDFDFAQLDEADRLFDSIGEDPRGHLRKLRRTLAGVERLLLAWEELRADLTLEAGPTWDERHRELAENLTGRRLDLGSGSRINSLSRAIWGDFSGLGESDGGQLDVENRRGWARSRMLERIETEIASLEDHYETLDFEALELDRAEAPGRALFDPSREATLARRYESEACRVFYKALKELRKVEAEFAGRTTPAPIPSPAPSLGSSRDRPAPTPREPQPVAKPDCPASDKPVFRPSGTMGGMVRVPAGSA